MKKTILASVCILFSFILLSSCKINKRPDDEFMLVECMGIWKSTDSSYYPYSFLLGSGYIEIQFSSANKFKLLISNWDYVEYEYESYISIEGYGTVTYTDGTSLYSSIKFYFPSKKECTMTIKPTSGLKPATIVDFYKT